MPIINFYIEVKIVKRYLNFRPHISWIFEKVHVPHVQYCLECIFFLIYGEKNEIRLFSILILFSIEKH